MRTLPALLVGLASSALISRGGAGDKVVCYYTNWAQYRPDGGKFFPENVDPQLCSHMVYAFAYVENTNQGWGIRTYEWNDEDMYRRFQALKNQNRNMKTLLAVGGWNHGSTLFSEMVSTEAGIQQFATNSLNFVAQYGFDGIDLDWEYPAKTTVDISPPEDHENFKRLSEAMREKINARSDNLLLTAAVGIGEDKIYEKKGEVPSYDVPHLMKYYDYISLMVYDMHGHWEDITAHQAMLYPDVNDDRFITTNVAWVVANWLSLGAEPEKLILGLAAYGRSFKLADPSNHGVGAPCELDTETGLYSGEAGHYTREPGYLAYYEVCEMLNSGKLTEVYDTGFEAPYGYGGDFWIGYDNIESIEKKVDHALLNNLGGIMFWAIDIDDYDGKFCGQGKYPLINAARNRLLTGNPTPTTKPVQTTKPQTEPPQMECGEDLSSFPHPDNCESYYICFNGQSIGRNCAPGLIWDTENDQCDFPANIDCCDGKRPCQPDETTQKPTTEQTTEATTEETIKTTQNPDSGVEHGDLIACYYTNWAQYRPEGGKFFPENIDPQLCTHLVYSFAYVEQTAQGWGIRTFEWNDVEMYSRFQALKNQNPNLKTTLAVGGWNHGNELFSQMVSTEKGMQEFATNSLNFIKQYGFDGIDLDWEYPAKTTIDTSPPEDFENFKRLSEIMREKITQRGDGLLLTAAVGVGEDKIYWKDGETPSYDVPHMMKHYDFISLMVYDMHGHWEDKTGHQAMTYPTPEDDRMGHKTNAEWVVENWIELGADPKKLNLGLGAYGRSFTLLDPAQHGIVAPAKLGDNGLYSGEAGTWTREPGYLSYYEICQDVNSGKLTEVYDTTFHGAYAYGGDQWVGYDTERSIEAKVDLARNYGLGGIMWWAIDIDDFSGSFCGRGKYPLMNAGKARWHQPGAPDPNTTKDPNLTTPKVTTPKATTIAPTKPPTGCTDGEYHPDPASCDNYYRCMWGEPVGSTCPAGLWWSQDILACDWPANVDCCEGQRPCK